MFPLKCDRCGGDLVGTRRDLSFSCVECGYFKFFKYHYEDVSDFKSIELLQMIKDSFSFKGDEVNYFF